jgi:hypothetical protein
MCGPCSEMDGKLSSAVTEEDQRGKSWWNPYINIERIFVFIIMMG